MDANHPSLDDILADIQRQSTPDPEITSAGGNSVPHAYSAGMADISAHIAPQPASTEHPETEIWESNLSPRQRLLPKIDMRMIGGIVAVMVMALGIGSATILTQRSQDIRQQAYEETLPTVEGTPATLTEDDIRQQQRDVTTRGEATFSLTEIVSSSTTLGLVVILVGAGVLLAFLFWLFIV